MPYTKYQLGPSAILHIFLEFRVSCGLSAAPATVGAKRLLHLHQPAQTGIDRFMPPLDRTQLAWTGQSLGPVFAGPYRVSNGLCRCMTIYIDRHRLQRLDMDRYRPARSRAGRGRSGSVSAEAGACAALPRCRKKRIKADPVLNQSVNSFKNLKINKIVKNLYILMLKKSNTTKKH